MVDENANDRVLESLERCLEAVNPSPILEALSPKPGPYALLNHLAHARERVQDVRVLYSRLDVQRRELTGLGAAAAWRRGTRKQPTEVPANHRRGSELIHSMKVDFESLFHFGSVLLDQFAIVCGYLAGVSSPEDHVFHPLVLALDRDSIAPALQPLQDKTNAAARWLHFWMRTYRNGFVVHGNRPWQRGQIYGVQGSDFRLFTPSPPGWEDDQALAQEVQQLLPLAPEWLRNKPEDYWERARPRALLERIIENIGVHGQADRDRIAHITRRIGVTTPSFEPLAHGLVSFFERGLSTVMKKALETPEIVNLGVGRGV